MSFTVDEHQGISLCVSSEQFFLRYLLILFAVGFGLS